MGKRPCKGSTLNLVCVVLRRGGFAAVSVETLESRLRLALPAWVPGFWSWLSSHEPPGTNPGRGLEVAIPEKVCGAGYYRYAHNRGAQGIFILGYP